MSQTTQGGFANTRIYPEYWTTRLQERLDEATVWKDVCNVEYTNQKVLHNPYLTNPTVQTGTRGSTYDMQEITENDDSVTINQFKILPEFIDRADLAQSTLLKQLELADRQGTLLNEAIESAMYSYIASGSNVTLFDNGTNGLGGASGSITVSATNVDDIMRGLLREIEEAAGFSLVQRKGAFIVWSPANFEFVRAFMMANGFNEADKALRSGGQIGVDYGGFTHYVSNLLNSKLGFAGVKKQLHLGILRDTYGQVMINDKDPGQVRGVSIVSSVDYQYKAWNNTKTILFKVATT